MKIIYAALLMFFSTVCNAQTVNDEAIIMMDWFNLKSEAHLLLNDAIFQLEGRAINFGQRMGKEWSEMTTIILRESLPIDPNVINFASIEISEFSQMCYLEVPNFDWANQNSITNHFTVAHTWEASGKLSDYIEASSQYQQAISKLKYWLYYKGPMLEQKLISANMAIGVMRMQFDLCILMKQFDMWYMNGFM